MKIAGSERRLRTGRGVLLQARKIKDRSVSYASSSRRCRPNMRELSIAIVKCRRSSFSTVNPQRFHRRSRMHSVAAMVPQSEINTVAPIASDLTGSGEANHNPFPATEPTAKTNVAKKNPTEILWALFVQNRYLGALVAGVIVLIVAATVAVKILRTEDPVAENTTSGAKATADEQEARPVSKSSTLAAPRVQGTFQTIRATQVFSGPSEDSALVAEIDKGVKINVVGSREGWLEIRSKHGRPPGFIRQEETARIGRNPQ